MDQRTDRRTATMPAGDLPSLAPFSDVATATLLAAVLVVALVVFHRFPGIDRAVSSLFFVDLPCDSGKPAGFICGSFPLGENASLKAVRQFFQYLPAACAAGLAAAAVMRLRMGQRLRSPRSLQVGAVFWAYVLAVGLVVNGVFKEFWGRPRPIQTDIFGGPLPFVPAGEISTYCQSNCSFISGEAAASTWLICLVVLLPRQYADLKPGAYAAAIAVALSASVLRMSFGAHYLSDVVIAGLATLLTFSLLAVAATRFSRTQT
jgi:membrane-associated phospholipid phosphatase